MLGWSLCQYSLKSLSHWFGLLFCFEREMIIDSRKHPNHNYRICVLSTFDVYCKAKAQVSLLLVTCTYICSLFVGRLRIYLGYWCLYYSVNYMSHCHVKMTVEKDKKRKIQYPLYMIYTINFNSKCFLQKFLFTVIMELMLCTQ